jgi:hypothetical protein
MSDGGQFAERRRLRDIRTPGSVQRGQSNVDAVLRRVRGDYAGSGRLAVSIQYLANSPTPCRSPLRLAAFVT